MNSRVDNAVSPLQFGGRAADISVGYAHAGEHYEFVARLDAAAPVLAPLAASAQQSHEQVTSADMHLNLLRTISAQWVAGRRLAVGADADVSMAITSHRYTDPVASAADYVFGFGTVGVAVSWAQPVAAGIVRADLSVPVVGLVTHSYSDIKPQQSGAAAFHLVTPGKLRGALASVAYTPVTRRRATIECRYTFAVMRYDDAQPVRSVSQTFSIGIVTRFGRMAP